MIGGTQMLYKPDWEIAKRRIEAWWQKDIIDRPAVQVRAPLEISGVHSHNDPKDLVEKWTDIQWLLENANNNMKHTFFGGEAFPLYYPNLGPHVFAGYLGCKLKLGESTVWSEPLGDDVKLEFDKNNKWWKLTQELTYQACREGKDKYFVGIANFHGGLDTLASIMGGEKLAINLIESPEKVREGMKFLEDMWLYAYETLYGVTQEYMNGSSTWIPVWSSGKYFPVSCDFMCMISTEMFEEFVLSELETEIDYLDRSLFHLDGPGAVRHLDRILQIPGLDGIQWVPGAGSDSMLEWIPLLRRIQKAGKCIHITVKAHEIKPILEDLSPKGIMFSTSVSSKEEAESLIRELKHK